MRMYEGLFIFPPASGPEARQKEIESVEGAIKKFGGVIQEKIEWGKRELGYPLKKNREGHFIILNFQLDSLKVAALREAFTLQESLLKFMITIKETKAKIRETNKAVKAKTAKPAAAAAAQ